MNIDSTRPEPVLRQDFAGEFVRAPTAAGAVGPAAMRLGPEVGWKVAPSVGQGLLRRQEFRDLAKPGDCPRPVNPRSRS